MSGTLGDSFADVRAHHDTLASTHAHAVEARAFTAGADIVFANGEYRPGDAAPRRAVRPRAHHVVQHSGAPITGQMRCRTPATLEREVERAARGV